MAWFNLGAALDKKGWSITKLAKELKLPYNNVARFFKPNFDPKLSTIIKLCEILDITPDHLYDKSLRADKKLMPKPKSTVAYLKKLKKIKK